MQASIPGTTVAIATPDLKIIDGQITTSSLQVAEHFGKSHKHVLRAIRNLLKELPEDHQPNFGPTVETRENPSGGAPITSPAYRMTRDGFTLLAMGFTGKEAMQWKVAYLTAFNQMEAQLLAQAIRHHNPTIAYDRISPAQAQDLKEIVATIVQAGIQGYGETWARFQRKFKVNSYLELPATRHLEARAYLLAKLPAPVPSPAPRPYCLRPVTVPPPARRMVELPPGKTIVDIRKLAAIWRDLGRLHRRLDGLGTLESDLPPAWWEANAISPDQGSIFS